MTKLFAHAIAFLFLALLTQVGGLAYLLTLLVTRIKGIRQAVGRWIGPMVFLGLYTMLSVGAGLAAPFFGRVPLPCFASQDVPLAMQSPVYCALNRHYVRPELKSVLLELSAHVDREFPGTITLMLDAGFPFLDGFPLLPHLSHKDGRSVDLAYYYRVADGGYRPGETKSPIGYWAFESPGADDISPCPDRGDLLTLRWDMPWFRSFLNDLELEGDRTRAALEWLTDARRDTGVSKVFLEPHLARSLGIESEILRFQGCRAARHDDHIHIEIAP